MKEINNRKRIRRSRRPVSLLGILLLLSPAASVISLVSSGAALAYALRLHRLTHTVPHSQAVGPTLPSELITNGKDLLRTEEGYASEQQEKTTDELIPLFPDGFKLPESQLWFPNYPTVVSPVLGEITITGGFMEDQGHSAKPTTYAVFSDRPTEVLQLPPSNRNLGVDYVVSDHQIRTPYPGEVIDVAVERGYGNRCYIKFNIAFELDGRKYPVFGAFAHAESYSVEPGQVLHQGESIGVMGSSGGDYPVHVDLRLWIEVDGTRIDLSPNVIEAQLDV
ncbi:MAG: M23 family metallopeptidase [Leptolyngbya sp. SIO1E4]|nr:M23 family metallopeptidase [Leptolyngbya sp. SIO1E4]